jgi:hypothetical protein
MTSQTSSARRLSPQPAPASPPSQPRAKRLTLGAQPSSAQAAVVLRTAADALRNVPADITADDVNDYLNGRARRAAR